MTATVPHPHSELTLAHIEAARNDIAAEAAAILAATADRRASITTTVSIDIPGGLTLPDGTRLTEVRVSRTTTEDGTFPHDQAEGWVFPGGYRRLAVSLVPALISRAGA
jgi:hypothetical protein